MPRGRKPKPTKLKQLLGNPGKRPLNDREPAPRPGTPEPPAHLDELARDEWRRVAPDLAGAGVLAHVDRAALAAYCQNWSRWVKLSDALARTGEIVREAGTGKLVVNPVVYTLHKVERQMHAFCSEFGMTPASRSRIRLEPGDAGDPFESFLRGDPCEN